MKFFKIFNFHKLYRNVAGALIVLLIFIPGISAQSTGPKTIFWEISGNGLESKSYLFGTIHILPKKEFEAFEKADSKLKKSDLLVLEMEIDVPMKVQMEWARKMLLPDGRTIPEFMEKDRYASLKSYALDTLGVKEFMFNTYIKMKPFAFYSALIPHAIGKKIEGYDMHFSKLAKRKNIPVHGLEDFDFQLGIFDSIPNEKQLNMFFKEIPDLEKEMNEMIATYKDQDIYWMANALKEEGSEYAELEQELLVLRNHRWSVQLDSLMQENSCFIAVGAAHLAGENGLIRLLRERNYDVRGIMLREED